MSYSFSVAAADKAALKLLIADKVAEVVHQQPVHAKDQAAILANANAILDVLPDSKDSHQLQASLSGYVSGNWQDEQVTELSQASITANIGWARKAD